jgi:hypothetical protein
MSKFCDFGNHDDKINAISVNQETSSIITPTEIDND